jgi:outer membrane receptor for ferrienterochelin and colicins
MIWKLNLTQHIWHGLTLNMAVDNLFNYVPKYYYSNSPTTNGASLSVGLSVDVDVLCKKQK